MVRAAANVLLENSVIRRHGVCGGIAGIPSSPFRILSFFDILYVLHCIMYRNAFAI